jgi:flagellar biosynthesis/type III secretory pathway protein FliH
MPKHDIGGLITELNEAVNKLNNLRTKHDDLEKENARLREALQTAQRDAFKEAAQVAEELIRKAYNTGFGEGMREHNSLRGGIPWHDSGTKKRGASAILALGENE